MLNSLAIRNYATVAALDMEFKPGMSAITGETGAGKSIILGALGLTLGDRADKTVIRGQAGKAEISAEFDTQAIGAACRWLESRDLTNPDQPGLCILRRVIHDDRHGDGRSRAYINGSPVTLANMKELGEMLLDIHSQHEHQSLLRRATHLRLLDEFGVDKKLAAELHSRWQAWHDNYRQLEQLRQRNEDDSAEVQLLAYQLRELDELALGEDEVAALNTEFKRLNNADELVSSVQGALALADAGVTGVAGVTRVTRGAGSGDSAGDGSSASGETGLQSLLHQCQTLLRDNAANDSRIASIVKLLENADVQLTEAIAEMRQFADGFEADPARLDEVNARLGQIHTLARKHRVTADKLGELTAELRGRLDAIEHSDEKLAELERQDEELTAAYQKTAAQVSEARSKAARQLAQQVNKRLAELGMANAALEVSLTPNGGEQPQAQGLESAELLVTTNPGQPPKPLIKIASGGELSRISLAIQVITAQTSQTPSLVFDEVDVGIGGGVAKVVGELLHKLGEKTQILCVTHQPQVASQARQHLVVSKETSRDEALTRIVELSEAEKVQEVARMLGGDEMSDESLAHAEQMVAGG
ncbi:MAG: DNA repair protein RecN [Pseudohongiellaceae bacterium]